jgi:hypothetical protein
MTVKVAIKCLTCDAKLGQMHVHSLAGGKMAVILAYIKPRVTFQCPTCIKEKK